MTFLPKKLLTFIRKLTVFAVITTSAAFALNMLVDNPYTHNLARRLINEKLKSFAGLHIDFKALKIKAVPLEISLFGFAVTSSEAPEKTIFSTSKLSARVSMLSIFLGAPRIGLVEATDMEFSWPLDPALQKALGLDQKKEPSGPAVWPLPYAQMPVETIQLRNARIYAEIPADPKNSDQLPILRTALSQLDLRLDVSNLEDIEVEMDAGSVHLESKKFKILEGARVETKLVIGPDRIRRSPVHITTPTIDATAMLSGMIITNKRTNALEKIDLSAPLKAKGNLSTLGQILNIEDTKGDVDAEGSLKLVIPIEPTGDVIFNIAADGKVKDGAIGGFKLRDSSAKLDIDLDRLKIVQGNIIVGDQSYGDVTGQINFNQSVSMEFAAQPKNLPFSVIMDAVKVDNFDVFNAKVSSPNLSLRGTGDPLKLQISANADFDDFELGIMKDRLKPDTLKPTCRSNVKLEIDNKKVSFNGSQFNCFTPNPLAKKGVVPLNNIAPPIDAQHSSVIDISGFATYEVNTGINLLLKSNQLNLGLAKGLVNEDASGTAKTSATIKGPYSAVGIFAGVNAIGAQFRQIVIASLDTDLSVTDKNLLGWKNLELRLGGDGLVSSKEGNLRLDETYFFNSQISANTLSAENIGGIFRSLGNNAIMFAVPKGSADLKGPLLKPFLYQGTIDAQLSDFKMNDLMYFDSARLKTTSNSNTFGLKDSEFTLKDLSLRVDGEMTKAKNATDDFGFGLSSKNKLDMDFSIDKTKMNRVLYDHLQIIPHLKEFASAAKLSGQIQGRGNVAGTLENLSTTFDASLKNARFLESKISDLNASGSLHDKALKLKITQSAQTLVGDFSINLGAPNIPYSWDIVAKQMDVRALGSKYFSKDVRNFAYLSARSKMSGHFADWWRSTGSLDINDIRVRLIQDTRGDSQFVDLALKEALTMNMSNVGWSFEKNKKLKLQNESMSLEVNTAGNRPPERLNIQFDGYFAVDILKGFISELETATGRVLIEGMLKGSVQKPTFDLSMRDDPSSRNSISVGLSSIRPAFTNLTFDARLTEDTFVINSLTAEKGKGRVTASGQVSFAANQLETSRLDINLQNASFFSQVAVLKSFESELSGALTITGSKFPLTVAGDIQVSRARSTQNVDLREQIINTLKRGTFENAAAASTVDPLVAFDLRISADNSIAIMNRNIQSVLSGNLNITGDNVNPVIGGQIEVEKGTFAYKYRRDFRITQGIITFDDPVRPDPRLDILASSELAGYRVFMAITGRASDPRVDLSIDPPTRDDGTPLSKVDILVLMSTGSLPDRQRTGIATTDAAKAEALNLLVGQFEEPVEKIFDMSGQTVVQQVYIDSYAGKDGTPTARLNLPLNVHEDWDVIFRVDNISQKLSVGYRIDESVSLSGSLDRQSQEDRTQQATRSDPTDTGVDLKFRFSFP